MIDYKSHLRIKLYRYKNLLIKYKKDSTTLSQLIERAHTCKVHFGLISEYNPIHVPILGK